jgi:hypothetical protein
MNIHLCPLAINNVETTTAICRQYSLALPRQAAKIANVTFGPRPVATEANNYHLQNFAADCKQYFKRNAASAAYGAIDAVTVCPERSTPNPFEGYFRIILLKKQQFDFVNRRFR